MEFNLTKSIDDLVFDLKKPHAPTEEGYRPLQFTLTAKENQPLRGKVRLTWRLSKKPEIGPSYKNETLPVAEVIQWKAPVGADVWIDGTNLVGSYVKSQLVGKVPEGEGAHEFAVEVGMAGLAEGKVLDHDGKPLRTYRADIDRVTKRGNYYFMQNQNVNQSEGRFAMGPLPIGVDNEYRLYAQIPGTWRLAVGSPFHVTKEMPLNTQTLQMPKPVELSGTVLDSYGKPSEGAVLSFVWKRERASRMIGTTIRTGADGSFRTTVSAGSLSGKYIFTIRPHRNSAGQGVRTARRPVHRRLQLWTDTFATGINHPRIYFDGKGRAGSQCHDQLVSTGS